jgi:signal transduction histidine kinase
LKTNARKTEKKEIFSTIPFITDTSERAKVAEEILRHSMQEFGVQSGSIFLADPDKAVLRLTTAVGPRENRHYGETVEVGEGMTGLVALQKEPMLGLDASPKIRLLPRKGEADINHLLSFPVVNGSNVLAVVHLSAPKNGRAFGQRDIRKCKAISNGYSNLLTQSMNPRRVVFSENNLYQFSGKVRRQDKTNNSELRLLAYLPQCVLLFDQSFRITFCNMEAELEGLFGRTNFLKMIDYDVLNLPLEIDHENLKEKLEVLLEEGTSFKLNNIRVINAPPHRVVNTYFSPIHTPAGFIGGGMIIIDDNTSNFEVQQQLMEAERLSLIGSLTSMITHEVNNPLDGVTRLVKLSRESLNQEVPAREYLDEALKGLNRMNSLVKSLLGLSRKNAELDVEVVPLTAVIESALAAIRCRISDKQTHFRLDIAPDSPKVNANDFYQILTNLLSNAVDAIVSESGTVTVRTSTDGEHLNIFVEDTGCGIPRSSQSRIFEAFWTTKEYGKGTGLGLAIVKKIVQRHSGIIQVESEENAGTKFQLIFPTNKLTI